MRGGHFGKYNMTYKACQAVAKRVKRRSHAHSGRKQTPVQVMKVIKAVLNHDMPQLRNYATGSGRTGRAGARYLSIPAFTTRNARLAEATRRSSVGQGRTPFGWRRAVRVCRCAKPGAVGYASICEPSTSGNCRVSGWSHARHGCIEGEHCGPWNVSSIVGALLATLSFLENKVLNNEVFDIRAISGSRYRLIYLRHTF
jgi:hypothetical protein